MEFITVERARREAKRLIDKLGVKLHDEIGEKLKKYTDKGIEYDDLLVHEGANVLDDFIILTPRGQEVIREMGVSQEEFIMFYQVQGLARTLMHPQFPSL